MNATNAKYTPGPWRMMTESARPEDAGYAIFSATKWAEFARCYIECDGRPNAEGMANAQLIAQAPTMAARIAELESALADATARLDQLKVALSDAALLACEWVKP